MSFTECRVGVLSMLLWLEIDGVRFKRGGNDLLWCCSGECNAEGDCDADASETTAAAALVLAVVVVAAVVGVAVVVVVVVAVAVAAVPDASGTAAPCK